MVHLSIENGALESTRAVLESPAAARALRTSPLEWVLRSLLRVRDLEDTRMVAVDLVRASVTCQWAALYLEEDGAFRRSHCSCDAQESLGETLPVSAVDLVLGGGKTPVLCPEGAAAREHVAADLEVVAPVELPEGRRGLFAVGPRQMGRGYGAHEIAILQRVSEACGTALGNAELVQSLREQVFIDFLTGCYNRRGFEAHLSVEVGRARRYGRPLTLLMVDIDHFKWINDSMGHPAGDHALRTLGRFLQTVFRNTDCVCRFGGDEFAVIFPETSKEEVARLAERLRVQIASLFPDESLRRGLTASIGVASLPGDADDADSLLKAADEALYRAKGSGRNRVIVA